MRRAQSQSPAAGFTLVEVLVAVVIFGVAMLIIGVVMRTAVRSWQLGHAMEETVQTARVAQDVILRDFNNLVYQTQGTYNQGFFRDIATAVQTYSQDIKDPRRLPELDEEELRLEEVTPPIDLSFRIEDSGDLDRLSFVRSHQSRFEGDPNTWGLRRVSYYVINDTLFRKEDDPYGFRPGQTNESNYDFSSPTSVIVERFMKTSGFDFIAPGKQQDLAKPQEALYLPRSYAVEEPLCDGVVIFNITAGYFKEGQWVEIGDWDSSAMHYRKPPLIDMLEDDRQLEFVRERMPNLLIEAPGMTPGILRERGQPDDLPGYLAVQLGARGTNKQGPLRSYTFFYSMPLGEERDIRIDLEDDENFVELHTINLSPRDHRRR